MKLHETKKHVEDRLYNRYATYYPEHNKIYFIRVIDCHMAEKELFELLQDINCNKEFFYKEEKKYFNNGTK